MAHNRKADPVEDLVMMYREYLTYLRQVISREEAEERRVSAPLLVNPSPEYWRSEYRIMLVGQETYGWYDFFECVEECVEESRQIEVLMNRYRQFMCDHQGHSPFWRFADKLQAAINPHWSCQSTLWNNLIKMDEGKQRIQSDLETRLISSFPVLQYEIDILRPHVVVFVTGPDYDNVLRREVPDVRFEPMDGFSPHQLAKLYHRSLFQYAYRTYHPRYLSYTRLTDQIVEAISTDVLRDLRKRLESYSWEDP